MKRIGLALRQNEIEGLGDLARLAGAVALATGAAASGIALLMVIHFR